MRWGHISKPQEQKTILQPFYLLLTLILSACVISSPFTFLLFCPCSHFHYRALLSFPLSSPCYPALPFPFPPNSLHLYPTLSHFPSLSQIPLFLSIFISWHPLSCCSHFWTSRITHQMLQSSGTLTWLKMRQSSASLGCQLQLLCLVLSLSSIWLILHKEAIPAFPLWLAFSFHKTDAERVTLEPAFNHALSFKPWSPSYGTVLAHSPQPYDRSTVTPNRKSTCASQLQKVVFAKSKSLQNTRKRVVYTWLKYVYS